MGVPIVQWYEVIHIRFCVQPEQLRRDYTVEYSGPTAPHHPHCPRGPKDSPLPYMQWG